MKKILLLHASAGAGHRKAAEAIDRGLRRRGFAPTIADAVGRSFGRRRNSSMHSVDSSVGGWPTFGGIGSSLCLRVRISSGEPSNGRRFASASYIITPME